MPHIVVYVTQRSIIRQSDRPLEAIERHVVLRRIEAAQPDVIPQLAFVDPTLHKPPVESESDLRLVRVEMVACD